MDALHRAVVPLCSPVPSDRAAAILTSALTLDAAPHVLRNLVALRIPKHAPGVSSSTVAAAALATELFTAQGRHLSLAKTLSRAAPHIGLPTYSALLLASSCGDLNAGRAAWASALADARIVTNKIDGEWTGVSLARYHRLLDLAVEAQQSPWRIGVPMLAAYGWRRVRTIDDIERLTGALRSSQRKDAFEHHDPLFLSRLSSAAVARKRHQWQRIQHDVVTHHAIVAGASPFADCVEVVVREILEYVMSDELLAAEHEPSPTLIALLKMSRECEEAPAKRPQTARAWAQAIQRLRGPDAWFLRNTADGIPYELSPTAATISLACAALLSPQTPAEGDMTGGTDTTYEAVKRLGFTVSVSEGITSENLLMDNVRAGPKRCERIRVSSPSRAHTLHIHLENEKNHPTAKVGYDAAAELPEVDPLQICGPDFRDTGAIPQWLVHATFAKDASLQPLNAVPAVSTDDAVRAVVSFDWQHVSPSVPVQRRRSLAAVQALATIAADPSRQWLAEFVLRRLPRKCSNGMVYRSIKHDPSLVRVASECDWLVPDRLTAWHYCRYPVTAARLKLGW